MTWSRAHWIVGRLALVAFPLTGAYMKSTGAYALDDVPRLIFRSRHLYLMLSAVANLALSGYEPVGWVKKMASVLITVSPLLLGVAFCIDPEREMKSSLFFRFGMYSIFAAGVLLAVANLPFGKPASSSRMLD